MGKTTMSTVFGPEARSAFVARYNRANFAFDHLLPGLDVFEADQLAAMAQRLPDQPYYSTADTSVSDGWKRIGDRRPPLGRVIESLEDTNSLVLLKHCEKDPEHGAFFRGLMDQLIENVGEPLRSDIATGRTTLVISSPGRVTTYHIDGDVNFLLQVRGHKLLHVFDPNDPTVLSEADLERFYGGDPDGARYKRERESAANVYVLRPGVGVHIPVHSPHWAQNLDDVSVGLSINFTLHSTARLGKIYKMNSRLRKAGLSPAAPGASAWQDRLKLVASAGIARVRPLMRPVLSRQAIN